MSETREVTVYKFDELSKDVQEKIIEREQQMLWESQDLLFGFEEWVQDRLGEWGFEKVEISYDFSYCQGSHFNFKCSCFDIDKFKMNNPDWMVRYSDLSDDFVYNLDIDNNEIYGDEDDNITPEQWDYIEALSRKDMEFNKQIDKGIQARKNQAIDFIDELKNTKEMLEEEFYKAGYQWIEDETSEETIRERLLDDEVYYLENGDIYDY